MASKVPQYILNLWHHFLSKIKRTQFSWWHMTSSVTPPNRYGYKAFSPLFLSSDLSTLHFGAFIGILPNLEMMQLHYYNPRAFQPSISLSVSFKSEVLQAISSLDKISRLREIMIVNPTTDISD
eukprot:1011731_1